MMRRLAKVGGFCLGVGVVTFTTPASSAPATSTFMNVMTVCGAGSTVNIDAKLKGSMVSLYDKEATEGRATQQIVTAISKLLPEGRNYELYLECVQKLLMREG